MGRLTADNAWPGGRILTVCDYQRKLEHFLDLRQFFISSREAFATSSRERETRAEMFSWRSVNKVD